MTQPSHKPKETPLPPAVVKTVLGGFIVLVMAAVLVMTLDKPQSRFTELPEAKPTQSMVAPSGCAELTAEQQTQLMETMRVKGGRIELSASYQDNVGTYAALMVRSAAGTIDQSHLMWFLDHGQWVAISPDTVNATTSPNKSSAHANDQGAHRVVSCLTAGAR